MRTPYQNAVQTAIPVPEENKDEGYDDEHDTHWVTTED